MPAVRTCPRCHSPLPGDSLRGLCPICLLQKALDEDPESLAGSKPDEEPVPAADPGPPNRGVRSPTWNDLCETVSYRTPTIDPARRGVGQRQTSSPPAVALDPFIQALCEARLMERAEVESFLERFATENRPREAEHLARELVRARRLTEYQAGALLQGKSRGLSIGNYLILDKLGKGGMGMVLKARHRRTKRIVALKVLPPSNARSEAAVLRFQREAEAVGRLGHPNIVAALDAGEFNGLHYFAMECVEGTDLARLIKEEGPLSVDRAIGFLIQAARGLKAAHDRGIFHRDIKPSNLMLDAGGTIKVLDLGLARIEKEAEFFGSAESDAGLTRPGELMGTVSFMSPEQAFDASAADHRSDIYSLGCTLYYLLTGNPPYSGVTRMACLLAHREQPIPLLRDLRPEVSPIVDATLQRMLAKAPADRYQSIAGLLTDLDACLPTKAVPKGDFTPTGRYDATSREPDGQVEPILSGRTAEEPSHTPVFPRVALLAIAALALIVVGLMVGRRLIRPGESNVEVAAPAPPLADDRPKKSPLVPPQNPVPLGDEGANPSERVGVVRVFRHGEGMVEAVAVSADGMHFLSGGTDGKAHLWTLKSDQPVFSFAHDGPVFAVSIAPDGRRALTGGGDKKVRLWDLASGGPIGSFVGHTKKVNSVAFSPGGGRVATAADDGTVRIWDADGFLQLAEAPHGQRVYSVAFAARGLQVFSAGSDKTVRVLATSDGSEFTRFLERADVICLAVSPDGRLALWGGEGGLLSVWTIDSTVQDSPRRLEGGARDSVRCVAFLPDNRHALAGYEGGKLLIWDVSEGRVVHTFEEESAGRLGVALLPAGTHALTSDDDGHVRLWNLPPLGPESKGQERGGKLPESR